MRQTLTQPITMFIVAVHLCTGHVENGIFLLLHRVPMLPCYEFAVMQLCRSAMAGGRVQDAIPPHTPGSRLAWPVTLRVFILLCAAIWPHCPFDARQP